MSQTLQVLLIDDHELFRAGMRHLLSDIGEPVDLHEATSIPEALANQYGSPIQLVLLDLSLPQTSGMAAITAAKQKFQNAIVVVLSGDDSAVVIRDAIDHGAAGFIPKSVSHSVFVAALKLVIAGETYIPRQALDSIAMLEEERLNQAQDAESENKLDELTQRQKDTLGLAVKGFPNKEIARQLNISEGTVKAHLSAAFKVLNVRNRTEAVLRFADQSTANSL